MSGTGSDVAMNSIVDKHDSERSGSLAGSAPLLLPKILPRARWHPKQGPDAYTGPWAWGLLNAVGVEQITYRIS